MNEEYLDDIEDNTVDKSGKNDKRYINQLSKGLDVYSVASVVMVTGLVLILSGVMIGAKIFNIGLIVGIVFSILELISRR